MTTDDTKALLQRLRYYGDNDRDAAALLIERQAAQIRSLKTLLDGADARNVRDGASIFRLQEQAADVQGERDANAILTAEVERLQGELKARHQRQHDAEALAGEYLMQRDDARAKLSARSTTEAGWVLQEVRFDEAGIPFSYREPELPRAWCVSRDLTGCAAGKDGDCTHGQCPQLRDGEPRASGRHCPLDA